MRLRSFQLADASGSTLVAFESDGRFCEPIVAAVWLHRLPLLLRSLVQPLSVAEEDLLLAVAGEVGFRWQMEAELPSLKFRISRGLAPATVKLEVPEGSDGWRQVALGADAVDDRLARRLALEQADAVAALWFGGQPLISSASKASERPDWLEASDAGWASGSSEGDVSAAGLVETVAELRSARLLDAIAVAESRLEMGSLAFSMEDDGLVQLQADLERAQRAAASLGAVRPLTEDERELLAYDAPPAPPRPPLVEVARRWWGAESKAWVPVIVGNALALFLLLGAAAGVRTIGKMLPLNLLLLGWAAWGANRLFDRKATGRPLMTPLVETVTDPRAAARAQLVAELGVESGEALDELNGRRRVAAERLERAELALTSMGGSLGNAPTSVDDLSVESLRRLRARVAAPSRPTAFLEQQIRTSGLVPESAIVAGATAVADPLAPLRRAADSLGLWEGEGPAATVLAAWSSVLKQTTGRELRQISGGTEGVRFSGVAGPEPLTPDEAARAVELLRIVFVRTAVLRRKEGALAVMVTAGMLSGADAAERRAWRKVLMELSGNLQVICLETAG